MKVDTVLDFAVFQLTPTRTRCELLISSNGVSEKLASGLLKPFLAHLRAAEEQIAVGGYSIRLEPPLNDKEAKCGWFTKGTMQRFVRFVSTPEVLERVSVVETELTQLEEELCNYTNEGDDQQSVAGSVATNSGGKSFNKSSKALRKDSTEEVDGENNETSRCRLIKAMESRYSMLQREQGMAFARAVAAGFDMDHLPDLLAFAEYFGAGRLSEACHKFASLCKKQQEGGLWLDEMELVAAEGAYAYPEANATGITIAPAGLAPLKNMIEASNEKGSDDTALDSHQRQSSGYFTDQHNFPPVMGMPPGQMPPYPWMHFNNEQGYDPRFMTQNPYINGNYGQMPPPYWPVPPPGPGSYSKAKSTSPADDEDDEDEVEEAGKSNSKKDGRKSSPRRRTSPLKKLQVGRSGKRSGMVLIRNINYITGSQDKSAAGNKARSTANDSGEESSEFETSSEIEQGGKQQRSEDVRNKKKARRNKKTVPTATEISSESSHASANGSHASANGKDTTEDPYFTMPVRGSLQSGGGAHAFDGESLPQHLHGRRPTDSVSDDSYILGNDGRFYPRKPGSQYSVEDQIKSSNLASKDGLVLPGRNQYGRFVPGNHDTELSFKNPAGYEEHNLDDSFIIPQRSGLPDTTHPVVGDTYERRQQQSGSNDTEAEAALTDLFIVPSRPTREATEVTRRALELEMPADQLFVDSKEKPDQSPMVEPEEIWMLPERSVGKESMEKRWSDVNVEVEALSAIQKKVEPVPEEPVQEEFYEQYHEQRDAKLMNESGSKRAQRDAKMKSLQDTLDKRKAELSSRLRSATKSSTLKSKREKEEAERKRLEDLAAERRNRIAARSGGSGATRTPTSTTASKSAPRPALSSTTLKKPAPSKNPLSRSVSSLGEVRKENTKPLTARQVAVGSRTTSTVPSNAKATPATRKSIATVRELVKPATTPKAAGANPALSEANGRSSSSRSLKEIPSAREGSISAQDKAKAPARK